MKLPVLHEVACFHTQLNDDFSHCAFSQKCRRWPAMMNPLGWKTIVYANEGSEVDAEMVTILTKEEFEKFYPRQDAKSFHGGHAVIGERGWPTFNNRLIIELAKRVQPGDFILHPFGRAHQQLVAVFPQCFHVENGIGYPDKPFGAWRIFESQAWRHYHWGRWDHDSSIMPNEKGQNRYYSWVVPNYFDLIQWPFHCKTLNEDYVLYMGRITPEKGMTTIAAIIRAYTARGVKTPKFVFAGQGDFEKNVMSHVMMDPKPDTSLIDIEYRGEVKGLARGALVGRARCMLMPTSFIEPFGGSGVEAMLTGTPLIAVDYGAFTETVREFLTGFRCNTLGDWMAAIDNAKGLERRPISEATRSRYSMEACAQQFNIALLQIAELGGAGWNSTVSHRIPPPSMSAPSALLRAPSGSPSVAGSVDMLHAQLTEGT